MPKPLFQVVFCYFINSVLLKPLCWFLYRQHKRGLTPAGYLQVIVLVAHYVGREINPQRYSSQLM